MPYNTTTRRRVVTAIGVGGFSLAGTGMAAGAGHRRNFRTHLSGANEVPPVETNAQGQAIFQLNKSGTALRYKLIVANIEGVIAAHIHCAPAGSNGRIGVTLFGGAATSESGILAEGTVTEPDDHNRCGWGTLDDVLEAIRNGDAYVNVHTIDNLPGEIRGQIH